MALTFKSVRHNNVLGTKESLRVQSTIIIFQKMSHVPQHTKPNVLSTREAKKAILQLKTVQSTIIFQ